MSVTLHQFITRHFNVSELRALCAELGIEYDDLVYPGGAYQGEGRTAKAHALVERMQRLDRLDELVEKVRARHPQAFKAAQVTVEPELSPVPDQEEESDGRDWWRWDVLHVGLVALAVALVATVVVTLVPPQGIQPTPSATPTPSSTPTPSPTLTPSITPTPSGTPTPSMTPTPEARSSEMRTVDLRMGTIPSIDFEVGQPKETSLWTT